MTKHMQADVAVVGGGPAGLAVAGTVARQGKRVILVEKNAEIGSPIHTSGGSSIDELRELGIPDRLWHPIYRCRFISPHNRVVKEYRTPLTCVLDIRGLYQYLAEQAAAAGAQILLKFRADGPLLADGRVVGIRGLDYRQEECEIRAKVVADASGFGSVIARKAGVHDEFRRFGVGAEYDLYAPHVDENEAVLAVGNMVAPAGYAWVFPRGGGRVRVGIGIIKPDAGENPRDYLDKIVYDSPGLELGLEGAQPIEYHYGLVPSEGVAKEFVGDGLVLVGDSAGQASTLVGEGIRYAIGAGRLAGRVIVEALEAGDVSRAYLKRYEREWRQKYERSFAIAYEVNQRMARWDDETWDRRLNILKDMTAEQFAQMILSDFRLGTIARLIAANPSLVKEGTRKLVDLVTGA